ncbi:MAG: proline dehydrogenase [Saprospiraceae bacterium]|jgi:proline dehydrogenase
MHASKHINSLPDFENTTIAFDSKSDSALKKSSWLFSMMNKPILVNLGSKLALWALNNKLPFVELITKKTVFDHFCGGESLTDCQLAISQLANQNVQTVLDYGAEVKQSESDFNSSMEEMLRAISFAAQHQNVAVVSFKITALAKIELLEKVQAKLTLSESEKEAYQHMLKRLSFVGQSAEVNKVTLFVDAEESWIQGVIDSLVTKLQQQYNKDRATVYNTFQMYRHDRLDYLKASFKEAQSKEYILAAKIVRGAYMEKERARALSNGYPSPIQKDKAATDKDYNLAIRFCVENYQQIASYNASHNQESNMLQAELMVSNGIPRNHSNLNFSQLYGMSDQITFNLSSIGFNATKYMPYGQLKEVIPYLIRRAQENTAVSGEMGREYQMILMELTRRRTKRDRIQ